MKNLISLPIFLTILFPKVLIAQPNVDVNPNLFVKQWDAKWITHPDAINENSGVYLFKKDIELSSLSNEYIINVSADNRYKLYVNGTLVGMGPARGDILKWRFETIDIRPFLKEGKNSMSAMVWNFGSVKPVAQVSSDTRFIVQSNSPENSEVNTNKGWKTRKIDSYTFKAVIGLDAYYVTGPTELFNSSSFPWDWKTAKTEGDSWNDAVELDNGQTNEGMRAYGVVPNRFLYPREIPQMESKLQYFKKVRRASGIPDASSIIQKDKGITIAANSNVTILLDQEELTNAYVNMHFSKGKDSRIKFTYAESLYYPTGGSNNKGNRNDIEGKEIKGNFDVLICDGGNNRIYEPLWWKSFRYVQLDITTKDEPLEISKLQSVFTAYPLEEKASFQSSDESMKDIWEVGWRTQRLCAGETFFDCPYYEQLQYTGDTRIQSLITYYVSGDTLLWRKAIDDYYDSRFPMGLTQSRYPSREPQLIPTFSLIWITMLSDYLLYSGDEQFVKSKMPAVVDILRWFEERIGDDGLPGKIEYWTFVDWVTREGWSNGIPPLSDGKASSIIGLQYIYTINIASKMLDKFGFESTGEYYNQIAEKLKTTIKSTCWDDNRKLFSDNPEKKYYSQHANVLAVLADVVEKEDQKDIIERIYNDETLAPCSYYFSYYLIEAMRKVGRGELFFDLLPSWKKMLNIGLTTFAEEPDPTRSDCHAWSASPLYFFLSLICGIEPANQGFDEVKISPVFGELDWINGTMPHKSGKIKVDLKKKKEKVNGEIVLPSGVKGIFTWREKQVNLQEGVNYINL